MYKDVLYASLGKAMEYIDWDPALTRAATSCHIGLMERNPSVTGFRLVNIIVGVW